MWFFVVAQETLVISRFLDLLDGEKKWGGGYTSWVAMGKVGSQQERAWFRVHYML